MNCKKCGAILNSNDLFCRQCGQAINNENEQIQNEEKQTVNAYQDNNSTSYQPNNQYNQYNTYQNSSNNGGSGNIVLYIILAIVFLAVGFGLGKLLFGNEPKENTKPNSSQTTYQEQESSKVDSSKNDNQSNNQSTTTKPSQNTNKNSLYVSAEESGTKVTFNVPSTLKEDKEYSDEETRCIEKIDNDDDDFVAWISIEEDYTLSELIDDIEDTANNKINNSDYNNVKLSETQTMTVNGKKFTYKKLDYAMESTKFEELYIAYEIDDETLYVIEIEDYNSISNSELEELLTITISK